MGFQCRWAGAVVLQSEPCATLQRLCRSASGRAGSLLMQHFGKGNFLHPPPSHTSPLCHPLSWGLCGGVGGGGGAEGKREPAGSCGFKGAAEPALPPRRRAPAGCPSPAPQPPPAALPVPRHRAGGVPQCPAHAAAPAPFCRVLVRSCLLIRA